ncbi:hypothetical protein AVEN_214204-1 [Araneus ventricosus]|uniref:Uncharacterized protein n=1 Tax=Araneus ventricosus TaxID=182803 RepID=A0A4Y2FWA4_ARAVE|nr:hypothetical protein AVEN_214204-1 [Araneus ventricosus]
MLLQEFPTLLEAARRCREAQTKQEKRAHRAYRTYGRLSSSRRTDPTPTLNTHPSSSFTMHEANTTVCHPRHAEEPTTRHISSDPIFKFI